MSVDLVSVYDYDPTGDAAARLLYKFLGERTPDQSISHKEMPTIAQHIAFYQSRPYLAWYMIRSDGAAVGSIYLTEHREVGIHIDGRHRGQDIGSKALAALRERHPGKLLANINPANEASIAFFKRHGGRLLQVTYQL